MITNNTLYKIGWTGYWIMISAAAALFICGLAGINKAILVILFVASLIGGIMLFITISVAGKNKIKELLKQLHDHH